MAATILQCSSIATIHWQGAGNRPASCSEYVSTCLGGTLFLDMHVEENVGLALYVM